MPAEEPQLVEELPSIKDEDEEKLEEAVQVSNSEIASHQSEISLLEPEKSFIVLDSNEEPNEIIQEPSGPYETHNKVTKEHGMFVCDIPLKETKECTTIIKSNSPEVKEVKVQTRTIENREFKVTNVRTSQYIGNQELEISNCVMVDTAVYEGKEDFQRSRPMNDDEILQFRREWGMLWMPVTDEEIEY